MKSEDNPKVDKQKYSIFDLSVQSRLLIAAVITILLFSLYFWAVN